MFKLKKDRNCGANVAYNPVYPTYPMMGGGMPSAMPGIMPGIPNTMPMPTMPYSFTTTSSSSQDYNNLEGQLNNINSQISNLDRRITRLETALNNSSTSYNTKYNSSNYQMM